MKIKFCIVHCVLCIFFYLCSVKVKVIENIEDFPQQRKTIEMHLKGVDSQRWC